jgi:transposase-like protein
MDNVFKSRGRKGQRGRKSQHPLAFKLKVAKAYVDGDQSYQQLSLQYGLQRSLICRWVKRFYGELSSSKPTCLDMTEAEQKELESLKKQNAELKKQLEYAELKATAFEIMVDVAEKQLGVSIKKKPGTKQP